MNHQLILYGAEGSRSNRCKWTLEELELEFQLIDDVKLIGSPELRKLNPAAKLPVLTIDKVPIFESVAICNFLCDRFNEKSLIANVGTIERGRHDQWCSFVLTELEAYLWSNAKHSKLYSKDKRCPNVIDPNNIEIQKALRILDDFLKTNSFLIGSEFSVTDIIAGFTINWAAKSINMTKFINIQKYLDSLLSRKHCAL